MADISDSPAPARRARHLPGRGRVGSDALGAPAVLSMVAVIAGTTLLGLAAGLLWAAVAPRAVLVAAGGGTADLSHPETSAFIVADAWFSLLSVLGGIISGVLGYLMAVRRYGPLPMAGVLGGGLAAALLARWAGQGSEAAAFDHRLASSRPGTMLHAPLALGGHGALALWPLAAGLVAGGIEVLRLARDRRRRPAMQSGYPGAASNGQPGPSPAPPAGQLAPPDGQLAPPDGQLAPPDGQPTWPAPDPAQQWPSAEPTAGPAAGPGSPAPPRFGWPAPPPESGQSPEGRW